MSPSGVSSRPPPPDEADTETSSTATTRPSKAPAHAVATLEVGRTIDRYTVLESLGAGAMGEVFAAYDSKLDRKVALKVLRHRNPEYEARLVREAQAMARLSHPNVVGAFDTGVVGESLYIAMEFVRGTTLRRWRGQKERSVAEVLRVYGEAGRGLAAAHAAGLVHRDFKPDNVLIADDGGVKVTDFGIARASEERSDVSSERRAQPVSSPRATSIPDECLPSSLGTLPTSGTSLESPMTLEGTLLGTPAYMAPEQFLCEAVDARTDQFSFCVALYEALYGVRPFGGNKSKGLEAIAQATLGGKIDEAPKGSSVPSHVRSVLVRGLSAERDARYPTMAALLDDLRKDPAARRRRAFAAVATGTLICVAAVATLRVATARQAKLCSATEAETSEMWNPQAANRAEKALLGTGVPYAADTWRRTKAELDGYARKWSEMHRQTCEATRIHGHQTENVMTLRMSCLDQRRNEVKALVNVLASADADVVAKAHQAAMSLTPVDVCKDVASLSAVAPEPNDPAKKAELADLRQGLAMVKEMHSAGRYMAAREEAATLITRARQLDYPPVLAELLLASTRSAGRSGAKREEVVASAIESFQLADAGHLDRARADAAMAASIFSAEASNLVEAERWLAVADGVVQRIDDRGALRGEWLRVAGRLRLLQGRYQESAARSREALELSVAAGTSVRQLVELEISLAVAEAYSGNAEEALRIIKTADERTVREMGPETPMRLKCLYELGFIQGRMGNARGALDTYLRAIEIAERVSPNDELLVQTSSNACLSYLLLDDPRSALPLCEKSLALGESAYGADGLLVAYAHTAMGDVLLALGRVREASTHYEASNRTHERTGNTAELNYPAGLAGMGQVHVELGDPKAGVPLFVRALELYSAQPASNEIANIVAQIQLALAKARWAKGERGTSVSSAARQAIDGYRHLGKQAEAKAAESWLSTHAYAR